MIYLKCPTCGTILGNRQQIYVKRLDDIDGNSNTDENTKNELKTKLFDEITTQKKLMLADSLVPELVKQRLHFKLELEINDKVYEDYTFYKSLESIGNNIGYFPKKSIDELKKICDNLKDAVGFNTYGYIKGKITDISEFKFLENRNYNFDGLYVKNK